MGARVRHAAFATMNADRPRTGHPATYTVSFLFSFVALTAACSSIFAQGAPIPVTDTFAATVVRKSDGTSVPLWRTTTVSPGDAISVNVSSFKALNAYVFIALVRPDGHIGHIYGYRTWAEDRPGESDPFKQPIDGDIAKLNVPSGASSYTPILVLQWASTDTRHVVQYLNRNSMTLANFGYALGLSNQPTADWLQKLRTALGRDHDRTTDPGILWQKLTEALTKADAGIQIPADWSTLDDFGKADWVIRQLPRVAAAAKLGLNDLIPSLLSVASGNFRQIGELCFDLYFAWRDLFGRAKKFDFSMALVDVVTPDEQIKLYHQSAAPDNSRAQVAVFIPRDVRPVFSLPEEIGDSFDLDNEWLKDRAGGLWLARYSVGLDRNDAPLLLFKNKPLKGESGRERYTFSNDSNTEPGWGVEFALRPEVHLQIHINDPGRYSWVQWLPPHDGVYWIQVGNNASTSSVGTTLYYGLHDQSSREYRPAENGAFDKPSFFTVKNRKTIDFAVRGADSQSRVVSLVVKIWEVVPPGMGQADVQVH